MGMKCIIFASCNNNPVKKQRIKHVRGGEVWDTYTEDNILIWRVYKQHIFAN